jgi:acyl-CoA reductase-like NAD-dependent aldehyde dehydrogenase
MESPQTLQFTSPATGEQFGQVKTASLPEVQSAVADLKAAFATWSGKPFKERARILGKFQQAVIDSLDMITATITLDTGKTRQDAMSEVLMTLDLINTYRKQAAGWLRPQPVSSGLYIFKRCLVERRPFGVVLVIAPWNYPFFLSVPPIISALLAGNTVIFKPSEVTAATGVMIEQLFQSIPELSPFIRVAHGDGSVAAAIIQAAPDYIFFTGSTATGKKVLQAASEYLIPVDCELGGKDAVIVLEDANINEAARWSVWGACYNSGQSCLAVERVYVVESVYEEFVRHAVAYTKELKLGYSQEPKSLNHLGPIADPRQIKVIQAHLDDALAKGAHLLAGGETRAMFFQPTVLTEVNHDMLVMREETFGPILPIMRVKDEAEAVRLANDNPYGLGASVWSNDLKRAQRIARQVQAGCLSAA